MQAKVKAPAISAIEQARREEVTKRAIAEYYARRVEIEIQYDSWRDYYDASK
jgi:hypothetical protein